MATITQKGNIRPFNRPVMFKEQVYFADTGSQQHFAGNATIDGTLGVTGAATVKGRLTAASDFDLTNGIVLAYTAGETVSTQFIGASFGSTDYQADVAAAGGLPLGIFIATANKGAQVRVAIGSRCTAVSKGDGTTINRGDWLEFNADGQVIKAATTNDVVGQAMMESKTDAFNIDMLVRPGKNTGTL